MEQRLESGIFLIASPSLRDPNFSRTVVLLCEHSEEGSMGLVVNRPGELTLAQAIPDLPQAGEPLFVGGPVQRDIVLVLHRDQEVPGAHSICDGIVLGGEQDEVMDLLQRVRGDKQRVRVFSGYAGWGAGQLEDEMRVKSWILSPASARIVFDVEPAEAWSEVLRSMGPNFAHLTTMPLDPRVN